MTYNKLEKVEESRKYDECPYCGAEFSQGMFNGDPLGESEEATTECPNCEKEFIISATYSVDFYCYKTKTVSVEIKEVRRD